MCDLFLYGHATSFWSKDQSVLSSTILPQIRQNKSLSVLDIRDLYLQVYSIIFPEDIMKHLSFSLQN